MRCLFQSLLSGWKDVSATKQCNGQDESYVSLASINGQKWEKKEVSAGAVLFLNRII